MTGSSYERPTSLREGRYQIQQPLGDGGMATVYAALDTELGVVRAVKVLHPRAFAIAGMRRRLKSEAQAMARLNHPNVLQIHDVGEDGGSAYVVMDLAEGGSLVERLEVGQPMEPIAAVRIIIQVLSALAAAHAQGVVHRDVKPHNILLDGEGRALLADFGIALVLEDDRKTRTGMAMGSVSYMPPEQRVDAASVGPAADIYSTGATLFQLLTGQTPVDLFLAETDSPRWAGVPETLKVVLRKACAAWPESRYRTAGAFVHALLDAVRHWGPTTSTALVAPHSTAAYPEPSNAFEDRRANTIIPPTSWNLDEATRAALTFLTESEVSVVPTAPPLDTTAVPLASDETTTGSLLATSLPENRAGHLVLAAVALSALALLGWAGWLLWPATSVPASPTAITIPHAVPPQDAPAVDPIGVRPVRVEERISPPVHSKSKSKSVANPVAGAWSGRILNGPAIQLDVVLNGPPEAVHGTMTSRIGSNSKDESLAGTFEPGSGALVLTSSPGGDAAARRWVLSLNGDTLSGYISGPGEAKNVTFDRNAR